MSITFNPTKTGRVFWPKNFREFGVRTSQVAAEASLISSPSGS